jgi:predicted nucleic acid-binding protein
VPFVIVVSDASPLVALSRVSRLPLLERLFGRVIVPMEVHAELLAGAEDGEPFRSLGWLECRALSDRHVVAELVSRLDLGEAEAIALAIELEADFVLMDERRGRMEARARGLRVVGLLGALVAAKQQGHLDSVADLLTRLVNEAGFWVADDVKRRALEAAGELPDSPRSGA